MLVVEGPVLARSELAFLGAVQPGPKFLAFESDLRQLGGLSRGRHWFRRGEMLLAREGHLWY